MAPRRRTADVGEAGSLERRRAAALEALVEHLAEEHLDVTAFDARVEQVRAASSAPEVDRALAGLHDLRHLLGDGDRGGEKRVAGTVCELRGHHLLVGETIEPPQGRMSRPQLRAFSETVSTELQAVFDRAQALADS